nr:reverse transcriptase domain-containing protein [Tanacetum cinerariifolium]
PELTIQRRSRSDPTLLNNSKMAAEGPGDLPVPDLQTMKELCKPSLNGRDTFYNGLTLIQRDTINAAAGGTFMKRRPEECYDLIENMTAHHNDSDTSAQRRIKEIIILRGTTKEGTKSSRELTKIPQPQVVTTNEFTNFMKANDAILKN